MIKAVAVIALVADAITWASFGKPIVAVCWLVAAVATALWIPAQ